MPRRRPINHQQPAINNSSVTSQSVHLASAQQAQVLADRLHSAAIHLLRRVRKQDVVSAQGPACLSALSVLVFGGEKTLSELATAEQVKPPTMSRIVASLKRSRLIEIKTDPKDARRMRIRPTAKGTDLLQEARLRRIACLAERLAALPEADRSQLAAATQILSQLLANWE